VRESFPPCSNVHAASEARCSRRAGSSPSRHRGRRAVERVLHAEGVRAILETDHKVINVAHQIGFAAQPPFHDPLEPKVEWATGKEFWILNTVWRDTIFEGNADDSMAAADALIDHGLLRAKRRERDLEVLERTATVRVREQTFRAFAVSKSILSWKDQTPARFEEILSARHAATMQHATMQNRNGEQAPRLEASDLGEKLEQAVHMALNGNPGIFP